MDTCTICQVPLRRGGHRNFCAECLAAMSPRKAVRQRLHQDRTWRAFARINEWPIDDGEAGEWARRCRGIWLAQLSHQLETRLRRVVEGVTA